jgi:hypothetical protein
LIQVKAAPPLPFHGGSGKQEPNMPTSTILVLAGIIIAFVVFGFTLAWGDYQTRNLPRDRKEPDGAAKEHHEFKKAA